ncbi:MAG: hypothetical protein J0L69_00730 [Bacteroidetes bacterium]|nr:hypothetical protein [Bacteroidota bacterium]
MNKSRYKNLPHRAHYLNRVVKNIIAAMVILIASLLIGIAGYMYYFDLNWIDALLNSSMILTGMGPVDTARTDGAKIFASFYAIYSGVAFLTSVAVIFAPVLHRFLHRFHLDTEE